MLAPLFGCDSECGHQQLESRPITANTPDALRTYRADTGRRRDVSAKVDPRPAIRRPGTRNSIEQAVLSASPLPYQGYEKRFPRAISISLSGRSDEARCASLSVRARPLPGSPRPDPRCSSAQRLPSRSQLNVDIVDGNAYSHPDRRGAVRPGRRRTAADRRRRRHAQRSSTVLASSVRWPRATSSKRRPQGLGHQLRRPGACSSRTTWWWARVIDAGAGTLRVEYELCDVNKQQSLLAQAFTAPARDLRGVAHQIADLIYEKITGVRGAFWTRIAYITAVGTGQQHHLLADRRRFGRLQSAGRGPLARVAAVAGMVAGWPQDRLRLVRERQLGDLRAGHYDRFASACVCQGEGHQRRAGLVAGRQQARSGALFCAAIPRSTCSTWAAARKPA